jgi:hypothetical protein
LAEFSADRSEGAAWRSAAGGTAAEGVWRAALVFVRQEKKSVFFSEEKNQKTFASARVFGYGTWPG